MGTEIERKFMLKDDSWMKDISNSKQITQGYLFDNGEINSRVRIIDNNKALITIKISTGESIARQEYEYEIPLQDGQEMLKACGNNYIEKTRHEVIYDNKIWEIDVFENRLQGLIVAEIELNSKTENINIPKWIGDEITQDRKYSNASLAFNNSTWAETKQKIKP